LQPLSRVLTGAASRGKAARGDSLSHCNLGSADAAAYGDAVAKTDLALDTLALRA
jgi:hypothetical protein